MLSVFEDLSAYEMLWFHVDSFKFVSISVFWTSTILEWLMEATGSENATLRSPSMAWAARLISWKSTGPKLLVGNSNTGKEREAVCWSHKPRPFKESELKVIMPR